jgi:glycosyltransferase involved in cell wall biosynthesis
MEALFWLCIAAATYSYFWYPLLLLALPARPPSAAPAQDPVRRVAVVIAARNEAAKIAQKLDNTLALERVGVELEVIVASDASDDATDSIAASYSSQGVRLVRSRIREGKEHAQGLAIAATAADLVVFTDAGTILPQDALAHLLHAFADPAVGAVSSVDRFVTADGTLQGEGAYVRYEMWLRDQETRFHSLVGLSGSFFAARRSICQSWDNRIPSDFGTALNCVRMGMRAISDRQVVGYYRNIADARKEYQRKVRTVTRGMSALLLRRDVLNFARYGRFSFQVFSHKVMRWAAPWLMLVALCSSAPLASSSALYGALVTAQAVLYLSPLIVSLAPPLRKLSLVRLSAYFVEVNVAILHATLLVLSGRTILTWEPSKR